MIINKLPRLPSIRLFSNKAMNRPRNRQPRPPRTNNQNPNPNDTRHQRPDYPTNVPTTNQVQPGVAVSIVLKADQSTGREVRGVVQDLLTRGNHPRGIKVRLKDGRVGRVQRMVDDAAAAVSSPESKMVASNPPAVVVRRKGLEGFARSSDGNASAPLGNEGRVPPSQRSSARDDAAIVQCPICGDFEGDEAAVAHHVQQHLDADSRELGL